MKAGEEEHYCNDSDERRNRLGPGQQCGSRETGNVDEIWKQSITEREESKLDPGFLARAQVQSCSILRWGRLGESSLGGTDQEFVL